MQAAQAIDKKPATCVRHSPVSTQLAEPSYVQPRRATPSVRLNGCACGGTCPRCQENHYKSLKGSSNASIRISEQKTPQAPFVATDGKSAATLKNTQSLFVDGGDEVPTPAPAPRVPIPQPPPPSTKPKTAPPKAPACPTSIKVAATGNVQMDADFAEAGWLTGFGGFVAMEVSDPSGKTWDGTAIHENLASAKNTCGLADACGNANGEGGAKGSTFKVGEEGNLLGLAKLPAKKNTFYDLHMIAIKGQSILHQAKKPSCEIQCEQTYDCGGKVFGPAFLINYQLKQATVTAEKSKKTFNVTSIDMGVAQKP